MTDRNLRLEWRTAAELADNPANWRRHPDAQAKALSAVMSDVGWAGAALYNEATGRLIDGHLRKKVTGDGEIPVLVGSWDEDQERLILATLDPIAAAAQTDLDQFLPLAESLSTEDEAIQALLEAVANDELDLTETVSEEGYTQTVDVPIYHPTGSQPAIEELTDRSTADELINEIRQADVPVDLQKFLLDAAERHVEFNFQRIANFYAHSPSDIQALMERSALVIVDYDQAIENGFVRLKGDIDGAFAEDYPDA